MLPDYYGNVQISISSEHCHHPFLEECYQNTFRTIYQLGGATLSICDAMLCMCCFEAFGLDTRMCHRTAQIEVCTKVLESACKLINFEQGQAYQIVPS
jgi:hypothetical protein